MFDVLVYLFENFYQTEQYPDQDTLTRKLSAAGFENEDINEALHWLREITPRDDDLRTASLDASCATRAFVDSESEKFSVEALGFIMFLESAGVLTPHLRELIIERALVLPDESVGLDKLKVIVLMVLWTRRGEVDALILDELIPDGEMRQVH
jgi:Smg protein